MHHLKPLLVGTSIYSALELLAYLGEFADDWITSGLAMSVLGFTTSLGFFLPGMVAGALTLTKPILVGCGLGVAVSVVYFILSVVFLGWGWAVAGVRLSPAAIPLLFAFTCVCTYAGHLAAKRAGSSHTIAATESDRR